MAKFKWHQAGIRHRDPGRHLPYRDNKGELLKMHDREVEFWQKELENGNPAARSMLRALTTF